MLKSLTLILFVGSVIYNAAESVSAECRDTADGQNYRGGVNTTSTGWECRQWADVAEAVNISDSWENHCRNPDGKTTVWCYSTNPDASWEYCDVPECVFEDTYRCTDRGGQCVPTECCTNDHYVVGSCSLYEGAECCLSTPDCSWKNSMWPEGSYALPRASYDCPVNERFDWLTGSVVMEWDDSQPASQWTPGLHILGNYGDHVFSLMTCAKVEAVVDDDVIREQQAWPAGSYCLYRVAKECPTGFESGQLSIKSRDGMRMNIHGYTLPISLESPNTLDVHFCCMQSGDTSHELHLPVFSPFLLLKLANQECQAVSDMELREEFFTMYLDTDATLTGMTPVTQGSDDVNGTRLTFGLCYYEAPETCYLRQDTGASYRGPVNFTVFDDRECENSDEFFQKQYNSELHYILDENRCVNVRLHQNEPFCIIEDQHIPCGVRECGFNENDYDVVSHNVLARQGDGEETAYNPLNPDPDLCTKQADYTQPWWQLNLLQAEEVVGFYKYSTEGASCQLRLAEFTVGMRPDDFMTGLAPRCRHNTTHSMTHAISILCVRPLVGQYFTIMSGKYVEYDIDKDNHWIGCLMLCTFKLYLSRNFKSPSRPLGTNSLLGPSQISVSSPEDGFDGASASLYGETIWCALAEDPQPFLQVDLIFARRISGIVTQGGSSNSKAQVTAFTVSYGLREDALRNFTSHNTIPEVLRRSGKAEMEEVHLLHRTIVAKLIRLIVLKYNIEACLRVGFMGSADAPANIALGTNVSWSSRLPTATPPRPPEEDTDFTDGKLFTCGRTYLEPDPWLTIHLNQSYDLEEIVIRHDYSDMYTPKMCKSRPDVAVSYAGPENRTSAGRECILWTETDHNHLRDKDLIADHDWVLALDYCRNPNFDMLGPWCHFGPSPEDWQPCSVPGCSDYEYRVEVSVSSESLAAEPKWRHCTTKSVKGFYDILIIRCDFPTTANKIKVKYPGTSFITACEIEVYGNVLVPPVSKESQPGRISLQCPPGQELSNANTGSASANQKSSVLLLNLTRPSIEFMEDTCLGKSRTCFLTDTWPHPTNSETGVIRYGIVCRRKGDTSYLTTCEYDVYEPGSFLTTSIYRRMYDEKQTCTWHIHAPEDNFVQVTFPFFKLFDEDFSSKGSEFLTGTCKDEVRVIYNSDGGDEKIVIDKPALLVISPESSMDVQLQTCSRFDPKTVGSFLDLYYLEAIFQRSECGGCEMQLQCSGMKNCPGPCGYFASPGYPVGYTNKEKCTWYLVVSETAYIELTFPEFDVHEELDTLCARDAVTVYSIERRASDDIQKQLIGSFCNTNKPPLKILSNWNEMEVEFRSDHQFTRGGFLAKYQSIYYNFDSFGLENNTTRHCPEEWFQFQNSCYQIRTQSDSLLTWLIAEQKCQDMGSHLASIKNENEMLFVHNLLLTSDIATEGVYIGFNDRDMEGLWKWTDGSPMSYSNWYSFGENQQPDGASMEDCSYIQLTSIRPLGNWHDAPCAYSGISRYMCKLSAPSADDAEFEVNMVDSLCQTNLFQCDSGECIHFVHVCDGESDCQDQSDESCSRNKTENTDIGHQCMDDQYVCDSGQCIAASFYCDFKWDCKDGSDEERCVMETCNPDTEFTCTNLKCISKSQVCDLWPDCQDGSDEQECYTCSDATAFQCYDGTCIPRSKLCDGMVDCLGSFKEDETLSCAEKRFSSCYDYYKAGYTEAGIYRIRLNSSVAETVEVSCSFSMAQSEGHVMTIIHHNSEERIFSHGFEAVASYIREIVYFIPMKYIIAIKEWSFYCEQFIKLECLRSLALVDSYWLDVNLEKVSYEYDEPQGDPPCLCRFRTGACDVMGWSTCVCIHDTDYIGLDYGYFTEMDRLPVRGFALGDTGSFSENTYHTLGPLICYQELDQTELMKKCDDGSSYRVSQKCLYSYDTYDTLTGCRDGTHLLDCDSFDCPVGYAKCPNSYCITASMVCDGTNDCPNGEDEHKCGVFDCAASGMYRCHGQGKCIQLQHLCDDETHCQEGDDELYCDVICPESCLCSGLYVNCRAANFSVVPETNPNVRKFDLAGNNVKIHRDSFTNLTSLGELILKNNGISNIPTNTFSMLKNLFSLDLSNNKLTRLKFNIFSGLGNLLALHLEGNNINSIEPGAFLGLSSLPMLHLRHMHLHSLSGFTFEGLKSLTTLDLSYSRLSIIGREAFKGLDGLQTLNISENSISSYYKEDFLLLDLAYLHSDDYKFCCFARLFGDNCLPAKDEFSSCEDLMSNDTLRAFLWLLGWTALLGNLFVFIWRSLRDEAFVSGFLVKYLALADFLMGIYMVGIGSVDAHYRGIYIENASRWKDSTLCKFFGTISTISSEASVFTLLAITVDRLINIVAPFSSLKLTLKKARMVVFLIWGLSTLIAVVPLFPSDYFKGEFYSRSGVCVSLHITSAETPGWEYSVAIFHGMNFSIFMLIFAAYGYMFNVIRGSVRMTGSDQRKSELAAARKITVIVLTDFCCWVPINIMGVLAMTGTTIPGEIYAWTVVFILPVNSALNPILYTISSIKWPWKKHVESSTKTVSSSQVEVSPVYGTGRLQLSKVLSDPALAQSMTLLRLATRLAMTMESLHKANIVLVDLEVNSVVVKNWTNRETEDIDMAFVGEPLAELPTEDDKGDDILKLGKLITRLLRAHTNVQNNKK